MDGESTSIVLPTLGSRTAKEQNRTVVDRGAHRRYLDNTMNGSVRRLRCCLSLALL